MSAWTVSLDNSTGAVTIRDGTGLVRHTAKRASLSLAHFAGAIEELDRLRAELVELKAQRDKLLAACKVLTDTLAVAVRAGVDIPDFDPETHETVKLGRDAIAAVEACSAESGEDPT